MTPEPSKLQHLGQAMRNILITQVVRMVVVRVKHVE
jgi:hypothetical protein